VAATPGGNRRLKDPGEEEQDRETNGAIIAFAGFYRSDRVNRVGTFQKADRKVGGLLFAC